MADAKISQLTGATTPLTGTEVLPIVQSGSTVKVSVANLTAGRDVAVAGLSSFKTGVNVAVIESGTTAVAISTKNNSRQWAVGTGYLSGGAEFDIVDLTASVGRVQIDTSGNVKVSSGNLVIGTSGKGVSFNDFGGTRTFGWGNVSSIAQDLATLFDNVSFTNRGLSIEVQVMTQSTTSAATSATFVGLRTGGGTWAFTAVNAATSGGPTITPSGSGTTLTLSFSAGGQFGVALVRLISQS